MCETSNDRLRTVNIDNNGNFSLVFMFSIWVYYYLFRNKQCNNQAQTIMQCKLKK